MSSTQELRHLYQLNTKNFSKEENLLLEGELFTNLYNELKLAMKIHYINYYQLIKFDTEKVDTMIDENFIRNLINDLVTSEEYSLSGIAYHTNTPEEVVYEIVSGQNTNPSLLFAKRIIELHRAFRCELYQGIIKKLLNENISNHAQNL